MNWCSVEKSVKMSLFVIHINQPTMMQDFVIFLCEPFLYCVDLTLYQWKQWLMFWSISRVQCSAWEWTWWIIRQHAGVMKYGREATSVIKAVRSVWTHLSRQLRNRNAQQTGKCHATNTETATARHLWFDHPYACSVGDVLFYSLIQSASKQILELSLLSGVLENWCVCWCS